MRCVKTWRPHTECRVIQLEMNLHEIYYQTDEYYREHNQLQSKGKGYVATPTPIGA